MLYKAVEIIGKGLLYLLATIITLWLIYIVILASVNTYCDCSKKLDRWWITDEKSMESLG